LSLQDRIHELETELTQAPSWEDRYKKIIQLGKALPGLPDDLKTEEAKVKGCQSQVWLHARLTPEGTIEFQGDSDALLVKGLVALLLQVYSGSSPKEILGTAPEFLKRMGFEGHLSPSRANGLFSMMKQIRNFAIAFEFLQNQKKS